MGAGRLGGWSAVVVDKSNRDDGLAPGTVAALAQARYGQTWFATLKGGSCGKSYVRVLVKTSALLCIVGQRRVWAVTCSSFRGEM